MIISHAFLSLSFYARMHRIKSEHTLDYNYVYVLILWTRENERTEEEKRKNRVEREREGKKVI